MLTRTHGATLRTCSVASLPSSCVLSSIIPSLRYMATKSAKKVSKKATTSSATTSKIKKSSTTTTRATAVPSIPTPSSSSSPSWLSAMTDIATSDRAAISSSSGSNGGAMYMVATPIGNLADMTLRSIRILADVDLIVCEDTKVTATLLKRLGIPQKPLMSYNRRNWKTRLPTIVEHATTQNVAYVSDAGTPGICDPGAQLAALCNQHGIQVRSVPGACAAIAALSASGLQSFARETAGRQARALSKGVDSDIGGEAGTEFVFMGFIPEAGRQRTAKLKLITSEHAQRTVVLYEAPHRLLKTLNGLIKADETDDTRQRAIYVAREITKIHEDAFRGTVAEACAWYKKNSPRGEFTIVLGPVSKSSTSATTSTNTSGETDNDTAAAAAASSSDIDDVLRTTPAGSRVASDGIHTKPAATPPISIADDARRRTITANSSFGESRAYRDRSTTVRRGQLQVTIEEHVADVIMAKPDMSARDMAEMVAKQLGIGKNTVYPTVLYMRKQSVASLAPATNDDGTAAQEDGSDDASGGGGGMTDEEHRLDETLARVERLAQKLQSQPIDEDDDELDDVDALKSEHHDDDDDGSGSGSEELSPEYRQLMEQVLAAASSVTPKKSTKAKKAAATAVTTTGRVNNTITTTTSDDIAPSTMDPVHIRELRAEASHQLQPGYLQAPSSASSTPLPSTRTPRGRAAAGVTRRGSNKRDQGRHTVKQRKTPVTMKFRG